MFVTATSGGSRPAYAGSPEVAAPVMIVNGWLPSAARSSTPVTVTVCGVLQFAGVNVTCAGNTNPSVRSDDASVTRTLPAGRLSSTIVNRSESPNSDTSTPFTGSIVNPAVSLSRFVHATSSASQP